MLAHLTILLRLNENVTAARKIPGHIQERFGPFDKDTGEVCGMET
jgi:hypothetical protein